MSVKHDKLPKNDNHIIMWRLLQNKHVVLVWLSSLKRLKWLSWKYITHNTLRIVNMSRMCQDLTLNSIKTQYFGFNVTKCM